MTPAVSNNSPGCILPSLRRYCHFTCCVFGAPCGTQTLFAVLVETLMLKFLWGVLGGANWLTIQQRGFRSTFSKTPRTKSRWRFREESTCDLVVPTPQVVCHMLWQIQQWRWESRENRKQTVNSWARPDQCHGISTQTSGLTRLVIFDYQPANREGR